MNKVALPQPCTSRSQDQRPEYARNTSARTPAKTDNQRKTREETKRKTRTKENKIEIRETGATHAILYGRKLGPIAWSVLKEHWALFLLTPSPTV